MLCEAIFYLNMTANDSRLFAIPVSTRVFIRCESDRFSLLRYSSVLCTVVYFAQDYLYLLHNSNGFLKIAGSLVWMSDPRIRFLCAFLPGTSCDMFIIFLRRKNLHKISLNRYTMIVWDSCTGCATTGLPSLLFF